MFLEAEKKNVLRKLKKAGISKGPQGIAVLNLSSTATISVSINKIRHPLEVKAYADQARIYRIPSRSEKHRDVRKITSSGVFRYFELASMESPMPPHFIGGNCVKISSLKPLTFSPADRL